MLDGGWVAARGELVEPWRAGGGFFAGAQNDNGAGVGDFATLGGRTECTGAGGWGRVSNPPLRTRDRGGARRCTGGGRWGLSGEGEGEGNGRSGGWILRSLRMTSEGARAVGDGVWRRGSCRGGFETRPYELATGVVHDDARAVGGGAGRGLAGSSGGWILRGAQNGGTG